MVSVMSLLMDLLVVCIACLTVFVNSLVKQFAKFLGMAVILLLNVMKVLSVGGGALLDRNVCVVSMIAVCI